MSPRELTGWPARRVSWIRAELARLRAVEVGHLPANELCRHIGQLEALTGMLLEVLDGGEEP
ncbi:hypothetical protein [Streptomyces sparsus]